MEWRQGQRSGQKQAKDGEETRLQKQRASNCEGWDKGRRATAVRWERWVSVWQKWMEESVREQERGGGGAVGRVQIETRTKHGRCLSERGPTRRCCGGEAVWAKTQSCLQTLMSTGQHLCPAWTWVQWEEVLVRQPSSSKIKSIIKQILNVARTGW